jgi:competence protein ComGC
MILFSILLLIIVTLALHHQRDNAQEKVLMAIVKITKSATPALGVGFDKPRQLHGAKQNLIYPEMPTTSTLEFIYVQ